jgi:hypothetical protein
MSGTKRQPMPEPVKRDILIEAGYRCAMPRCMVHTLEIAHIVSRESGGDNSRENLIALCPNHHTQYDIDKKIDIKAIKIIKNKLGIINGRYNDFEQRVFRHFANNPQLSEIHLSDAIENEIQLMNAVQDGYIRKGDIIEPPRGDYVSGYKLAIYQITQEGREFIRKWFSEDEELS